MPASLLEHVSCNLCGGEEVRVIQPAEYSSEFQADELQYAFSSSSGERLNHQLVACASCGLQYVSPRVRADAVLEGYAEGSDERFVSQARGRELTFSRCLDAIDAVWNRPPGRLLDIGTGGGSFLYVARKRGWQVEGCEPNKWLCEWARQNYRLNVQPGTVFDQDYAPAAFDVVSLWDVLEHTSDPKKVIGETHRLLRNEGLLVVNYPDIGSWIARAMGRSWVFLLNVHLYYFTRTTITKLLIDAGYDVVAVRPHYQRLGLGYVLHRAVPYAGAPARAVARLVELFGASQLQVPYWMGQTLVIARKTRRTPLPAL